MKGRTLIQYMYVFTCVFVHLLGGSCGDSASVKQNNENSPQSSGNIIMREDAEEIFYNVDLEKYNDLGIKCPDPEPPKNGEIVGEGSRVGSVVYVQCHEGYRLQGPTVMACVPTGNSARWDPVVTRECVEGQGNFDEPQSEAERTGEGTEQGTTLQNIKSEDKHEDDYPPFINPRQNPAWFFRHKHNELHRPEEDQDGLTQELRDQIPPSCLDRPDPGPCRAAFKRYYFSKSSMECHSFVYGGCYGNQNNFQTLEECNLECLGRK